VQLYRCFVSQSSEFCRHNPLCCFSTSVCCCWFRYRLSPETFGYSLVYHFIVTIIRKFCREAKSQTNKKSKCSVGIALGYGLDDLGSRVWFPARAGNFSFHHRVQNGSRAHPASHPMGTTGSFLGVKRHMPSWHGAQLKHRGNFTFTFTLPLPLSVPLFYTYIYLWHTYPRLTKCRIF
jgi:hypothetical protein